MQKSRDDVLKVYRAMGVDKVKAFTEPEDHIAIELEFMAYLCDKTSTALRDGIHAEARKYLECQRDFLKEHLAKWVPLLVADILQGSRRDFYRAVGMITKGYVEMDGEVVQGMIDEIALSHDPKTRAAA
jgi:anaerobic sulfite reductase subunit A